MGLVIQTPQLHIWFVRVSKVSPSLILFPQDSKRAAEIVPSPSLDVFLPEDEDNPYEFVATAVTRKPCSLDISRPTTCSKNGEPRVNQQE